MGPYAEESLMRDWSSSLSKGWLGRGPSILTGSRGAMMVVLSGTGSELSVELDERW